MEELELIKSKIKEIKEELINIRRDLHSNPELSEKEFQTMNTISNHLKKYNIEHKTEVANTGIIADIKGEDKSFTVAFRADIDALPIDDLKNCSYRSKNKGVCHACGHDVHTAINMGIANIFSNNDNKIIPPCNIRLIFQPAEETVGGALQMIKENALENVNVIYALHVSPNIDTGYVQINDDIVNAGCLDFKIKVYGKSSHGANPAGGVDAIVISSKIINDLQTIISRNIQAEDQTPQLGIDIVGRLAAVLIEIGLHGQKHQRQHHAGRQKSELVAACQQIAHGLPLPGISVAPEHEIA